MTITIDGTPHRMVPVEPTPAIADALATEFMQAQRDVRARLQRFPPGEKPSIDGQEGERSWAAAVAASPTGPDEAVVELVRALATARSYAIEYIEENGGIDGCEMQDRATLEQIDAVLARFKVEADATGRPPTSTSTGWSQQEPPADDRDFL